MSGHTEEERRSGRCAGYGQDELGAPTDYTVLNYAMRGAIEFCSGGSRGHSNPTQENTEKCLDLFQALDRQYLNSG
jgi:hypothetical protein